MTEQTEQSFDQLQKALNGLEEILLLKPSVSRVEIDAAIHRFEFSIELFWNSLRKLLFDEYGIEVNAPKTTLQQAYANNLISVEAMWLSMLNDRNLTSHCYQEKLADEVYARIKKYAPFMQEQLQLCLDKKRIV